MFSFFSQESKTTRFYILTPQFFKPPTWEDDNCIESKEYWDLQHLAVVALAVNGISGITIKWHLHCHLPLPLLWPCVLTLERSRGRGRRTQRNQTWWESTLHLMKQLPGSYSNCQRLMIWSNYIDKMKEGTFSALSEHCRVKRLRRQITQEKKRQRQILLLSHLLHHTSWT